MLKNAFGMSLNKGDTFLMSTDGKRSQLNLIASPLLLIMSPSTLSISAEHCQPVRSTAGCKVVCTYLQEARRFRSRISTRARRTSASRSRCLTSVTTCSPMPYLTSISGAVLIPVLRPRKQCPNLPATHYPLTLLELVCVHGVTKVLCTQAACVVAGCAQNLGRAVCKGHLRQDPSVMYVCKRPTAMPL